MKRILTSPLLYLLLVICVFYLPVLAHGFTPTPADTIVGLYHPFRDAYSSAYPRGIPFKNSLITDPVRQQYPWKFLSIESLKEFSLPIWNPYSFSGTPLLGGFQAGVFYPLNGIFFLLSFIPAWNLFIVSQSLLSGIGMYFYLKHLKLHPYALYIGSLAFTLSGFSIAWLEWGSIISTYLWLPFLLLSIDHLLETKSIKWFILFLFAFISMIFAGHLQTFTYMLGIISLYILARSFTFAHHEKNTGFIFRKVAPFLLLFFVGAVITIFQWLPTLRFIGESARSVDQIGGWQKDGWFIPWQHLIQFVIPDYFGNPATGNYWGVWNYGEFIGYIGIVPLLFALFALVWRHDKKTYFFGSILLLSLIFSTPNPVAKLPYILNMPFLSTTQPTRLMSLIDFSLVMLAALGVDYFIKHKRLIVVPLAILGCIYGAIFMITKVMILKTIGIGHEATILNNSKLPVLLFVTACICTIGIIVFKQKRIQLLLIVVLLLLSTADLLRFSQKFTPFTNPAYLYPSTSTISFLQSHIGNFRMMSVDDQILPPNFSNMYHIQDIDGYDPLYLRRYGELIIASERNTPDISTPFGFNRIITPKRIDSQIIDMLGVKYILSLTDLHDSKVTKVFQEGGTRIYENQHVFPRAFFVVNTKSVTSKQQAIAPYFAHNFDLRNTAIVEDDTQSSHQSMYASESAVQINSYQANAIQMHVVAAGTSFLVLTDIYYPTWHALAYNTTGSTTLPIVRTDYAFRGVVIPKGEWTIVMKPSLF